MSEKLTNGISLSHTKELLYSSKLNILSGRSTADNYPTTTRVKFGNPFKFFH